MINKKKILTICCACMMLLNSFTAYADVTFSARNIPLVMASNNCSKLAVSQVTDYVNIREEANTKSKIVGKIYNNCAAEILETVDGEDGKWYKMKSGSVSGYIKAQYFITGKEAEDLAQKIGRRYATVDATNLRLRAEPNLESEVLTMLSTGARYIIEEEAGDFYKVEVDETLIGYIAKRYCDVTVEFDQAISLEEEQKLKEEEEKRKEEAEKAIEELKITLKEQTEQVEIKVENQTEVNKDAVANEEPPKEETEIAISDTTKPAETTEIGLITPNPGSTNVNNNVQTEAPTIINPENVEKPSGEVTVIDENEKSNDVDIEIESDNKPNSGKITEVDEKENNKQDVIAFIEENREYIEENNVEIGPGMDMSMYEELMKGPGKTEVVSATRSAIVAYAKQFLGNPYIYGGTDLINGTDCSGFTMGVYKYFGINTGRTSRDQAANIKKINYDEMQPGDLVFYASGDYINHVAMYIGDGQIIHAAGRKTGIIISPYDYRTPYMAGTFLD